MLKKQRGKRRLSPTSPNHKEIKIDINVSSLLPRKQMQLKLFTLLVPNWFIFLNKQANSCRNNSALQWSEKIEKVPCWTQDVQVGT